MSDKPATVDEAGAGRCNMFDKELAVHMLRQHLKLARCLLRGWNETTWSFHLIPRREIA